MKFTKYLQAAVFGLLIACSGAFAQTQSSANASQQSTSQAQNQGVTLESTVNMPPASPYVKQDTDFNTNQAASAPAVIGSAAPSPAGCVAIEGASASVVFMNGGKSSAVEPPGCMANLLADRVGRLQHNADGTWRWDAVLQLEAWCSFGQYKKILERSKLYTCQETVDEQNAKLAATVLRSSQLTDPYVRAREGLPPLK
ncbi:MAG: hypothetical protein WCT07_02885 [Candidatus Paceibacterota bacterium]